MFLAALLDRQRRQASAGADGEESGLKALQRIARQRRAAAQSGEDDSEGKGLNSRGEDEKPRLSAAEETPAAEGRPAVNSTEEKSKSVFEKRSDASGVEGPASAAVAAAHRFAASAVSSFTSSSLLSTKALILATVLGSDETLSEEGAGFQDASEGGTEFQGNSCCESVSTAAVAASLLHASGKQSAGTQRSDACATASVKWNPAELAEAERLLAVARQEAIVKSLEKRASTRSLHCQELERRGVLPPAGRWTDFAAQVETVLKRRAEEGRRKDDFYFKGPSSPFPNPEASRTGLSAEASSEDAAPASVSFESEDEVWLLLNEESKHLQGEDFQEANCSTTAFLEALLKRLKMREEKVEAERRLLEKLDGEEDARLSDALEQHSAAAPPDLADRSALEKPSALLEAAAFANSLAELENAVHSVQSQVRSSALEENATDRRLMFELQEALDSLALHQSKRVFLQQLIQMAEVRLSLECREAQTACV